MPLSEEEGGGWTDPEEEEEEEGGGGAPGPLEEGWGYEGGAWGVSGGATFPLASSPEPSCMLG